MVELLLMIFTHVAADHIVNQTAKLRYVAGDTLSVPMVIRAHQGDRPENTAKDCMFIEYWMAQVPGLIVVAPASPADAKEPLNSTIRAGHRAGPLSTNFLLHKRRFP